MEFSHIPVLLQPCLDGLNIDPAGIYLDGTAGGAGHSREIAKRLTTGRLISLDQDPDAVAVATERLKGLPAQVVQVNFREAARVLAELGIPAVNGALLDLGVSSHQLDDAARGFSYHADAPLDMRMSQQGPTAADLVNTLDREELTRILRDYGEEPYAWQIAGKIIAARETRPITTTMQLADIVAAAVPPAERRKAKNPARRTFQAIRIAVNSELDALNEGLDAIFNCLAPGGRLCVITFHSLEDRLVKNKFRRWAQRCTCPPEQPICTCGGVAKAKLITRKPIEANTQEAAPKLETPRPQVKVVRGGNRGLNRARRFAQATLRTLALAIVLGLVVSVLYSHAKLTELSGQINEVNTQLTAAQSEYDYLSTKMSDITSRASLQEVAEGQLGLVKLDPSQITYVQLEDQSIIEKSSSSAVRLLDKVRTAALNLLDGLNP